ncbi:DUF4880 domain-containing protein [Pseudomonas sp. RL_15y_Pfl2_60]|uniref:DUF4880 domain-containing protein n=1 Tax=Pseudomonas sp. RL_15y_Pfl2_60 TaxID=3088709 RepID=UPI0030D83ABA
MSKLNEQHSQDIVREAVEWQMRLWANAGNAELQQQLHEWLRQDAEHQIVWQRLQRMSGLFQGNHLPESAHSISILQRAETDLSRRRTLKLLGLGFAVGGSALLITKPPGAWRADFTTAIGERRLLTLGADTEVLLNTESSVDVQGRELVLHAGEVLVDGAQWQARCRFAQCSARQARVLMRERDGYSEIRVQSGQLLITSKVEQLQLQAGEGVSVSAEKITPLANSPLDPFAWARGLLIVNDIRLDAFLAEAGRYRQGWLGCDSDVASLRLSGVFHIDQPEVMLHNITHLLPVKIVERTRWWVRMVATA